MRQSDGAPELKQAQRQRAQEILSGSARTAVADATVILTNPTHFSVALRYRPGVDAAPVVVARGRGDVALAIRELARPAIKTMRSIASAMRRRGTVTTASWISCPRR